MSDLHKKTRARSYSISIAAGLLKKGGNNPPGPAVRQCGDLP